ncbi:MAG: glutamyl-tRNA reductase [Deltaproteobacteria bacterium]|nr:glutamyl-tRNA reductase [Deltaproteobacteria bacterium]
MTKILDIGMNHISAPVGIRECFDFDAEKAGLAFSCMRESELIREGIFLSTCNRVEALVTTDCPEAAGRTVISIFSRLGGVSEERFVSNIYMHEDMDAVTHIFRVASSLDSMVVGEPQILGQIKDAYHRASIMEKTTGVILNRLMHRAFHTAKRVRSETGISESAVSVSYAAVELAKKIFSGLAGRKVLLIGAGEMAELAARHMIGQGVERLLVANRTFEKAVQLADSFKGSPILFDEIGHSMIESDIVITSTGSRGYVVTHDMVKRSLRERRNRPLFFIDIAVPRDVEPSVNDLSNTYVYDIDDLMNIVEENSAQRKDEAVKAERIVQEEVIRFERWLKTLEIVPTIIALKEKTEALRRTEVERSLSSMGQLTESQVKAVETLTVSLADKIINEPILALKARADRKDRENYLDVARKLFNLDMEDHKRS